MAEKLKDGWKFGDVKNPETKEHPVLLLMSNCQKTNKQKDALFISVVRSFE